MPRPLIGVTGSLEGGGGVSPTQSLDCRYVDAVARAGGCPVVLPLCAESDAVDPIVAAIDGLVITGGPGVVSGLVGELPADLPPVEPRRARADARAFASVREQGKPVLGICYGMQFVNAALGGTVFADVQAQLGAAAHAPARNRGVEVYHRIDLVPGTVLAGRAGRDAMMAEVNSFHIQAVRDLGAGLQVSARSPDGLVEGLESEDGLLVGVQFHPEKMPGTVWDLLFEDLVARASP